MGCCMITVQLCRMFFLVLASSSFNMLTCLWKKYKIQAWFLDSQDLIDRFSLEVWVLDAVWRVESGWCGESGSLRADKRCSGKQALSTRVQEQAESRPHRAKWEGQHRAGDGLGQLVEWPWGLWVAPWSWVLGPGMIRQGSVALGVQARFLRSLWNDACSHQKHTQGWPCVTQELARPGWARDFPEKKGFGFVLFLKCQSILISERLNMYIHIYLQDTPCTCPLQQWHSPLPPSWPQTQPSSPEQWTLLQSLPSEPPQRHRSHQVTQRQMNPGPTLSPEYGKQTHRFHPIPTEPKRPWSIHKELHTERSTWRVTHSVAHSRTYTIPNTHHCELKEGGTQERQCPQTFWKLHETRKPWNSET